MCYYQEGGQEVERYEIRYRQDMPARVGTIDVLSTNSLVTALAWRGWQHQLHPVVQRRTSATKNGTYNLKIIENIILRHNSSFIYPSFIHPSSSSSSSSSYANLTWKTVLLKLSTDRHEASWALGRLSVTAELLVWSHSLQDHILCRLYSVYASVIAR